MPEEKRLRIRNSAAEFLVFTRQVGADSFEVRVADETIWLTPELLGTLFGVDCDTILEQLRSVFEDRELDKDAVSRFFPKQTEGSPECPTRFYNLDAAIALGFRVKTQRAIQFRKWAMGTLRDYAVRGYLLDAERFKNGAFFCKDYFEELLAEIREIRASQRKFLQKITDIYETAMDYDAEATTTRTFFSTVQDKLHFAIHGHTAAELIMARADKGNEHMGLVSWKNAPRGKILKTDVAEARNYLTEEERDSLNRIVTMYLDFAELQAERHIPMTMEDWAKKLDAFLKFNERDILDNPVKVSQAVAKEFAESEFEKYRIVQDRRFESDFDRHIKR
jgi:hypothetical protein